MAYSWVFPGDLDAPLEDDDVNRITAYVWGESGIRALLEGRLGSLPNLPTPDDGRVLVGQRRVQGSFRDRVTAQQCRARAATGDPRTWERPDRGDTWARAQLGRGTLARCSTASSSAPAVPSSSAAAPAVSPSVGSS